MTKNISMISSPTSMSQYFEYIYAFYGLDFGLNDNLLTTIMPSMDGWFEDLFTSF